MSKAGERRKRGIHAFLFALLVPCFFLPFLQVTHFELGRPSGIRTFSGWDLLAARDGIASFFGYAQPWTTWVLVTVVLGVGLSSVRGPLGAILGIALGIVGVFLLLRHLPAGPLFVTTLRVGFWLALGALVATFPWGIYRLAPETLPRPGGVTVAGVVLVFLGVLYPLIAVPLGMLGILFLSAAPVVLALLAASLGGLALAVLSFAAGVKVLNLAEPWRVRAIMFAAVGALAGAFPVVLVLFSPDFDPEDLVHLIAAIAGTSVLIANVFVILQLSRSRRAFVQRDGTGR